MNYQCSTEFNIATSLLDCDGYKKRVQESTDPLKYKFDLKPSAMCFMPGQTFQGLQMVSQRTPPPQLLDIEMTLKKMPILEQDNEYVIKNIHNQYFRFNTQCVAIRPDRVTVYAFTKFCCFF